MNAEVAKGCDFAVVTVPYSAQAGTSMGLRGLASGVRFTGLTTAPPLV